MAMCVWASEAQVQCILVHEGAASAALGAGDFWSVYMLKNLLLQSINYISHQYWQTHKCGELWIFVFKELLCIAGQVAYLCDQMLCSCSSNTAPLMAFSFWTWSLQSAPEPRPNSCQPISTQSNRVTQVMMSWGPADTSTVVTWSHVYTRQHQQVECDGQVNCHFHYQFICRSFYLFIDFTDCFVYKN